MPLALLYKLNASAVRADESVKSLVSKSFKLPPMLHDESSSVPPWDKHRVSPAFDTLPFGLWLDAGRRHRGTANGRRVEVIRGTRSDMAVGQNQWYHFGVGTPPILVYFSGDWDDHWGYGILTHSHMNFSRS